MNVNLPESYKTKQPDQLQGRFSSVFFILSSCSTPTIRLQLCRHAVKVHVGSSP